MLKENTDVKIKDKLWLLTSGDATATGKTIDQAITKIESSHPVKCGCLCGIKDLPVFPSKSSKRV